VLATPGALDLLAKVGVQALVLLDRHQRGDWGSVSAEDARENGRSVLLGFRIMSIYEMERYSSIWIITEADRSATTLLLPDEY
jgi:hypothetical protein